jgi:hypothetical protein
MVTPTSQTILYPQILAVGLGGNELDFVDIAQGALGHRVKVNVAIDDLNEYFKWNRVNTSAVGAINDLYGFQLCLNSAFDDGFTDLDSNAQGLSFTTGVLANRNNKTGTINDLITAYILFTVYGSSAIDTSNKFFNITNLKSMLTDQAVSGIIGTSLSENMGETGFVDKMFQYLVSSDPIRFVHNGMIVTLDQNETSGTWQFTPGDLVQFVLKFQFNAPVTQVTLGLSDMDNVVGVANNQAPQKRTVIPTGQIFCVTLQLYATANRSPRRITQLANLLPSAPQNVVLFQTIFANQLSVSWEPPSNTGGYTIPEYIVVLTDVNTGTTVSATVVSSPHTFTSLDSSHSYTVTVAAVNSVGEGLRSDVSNSIRPRVVDLSLPSVPENVTLGQTVNPFQLVVSWPSGSINEAITGYTLDLNDSDATLVESITTTSNPYTFSNLDSTKLYVVTVRASNVIGTGGESVPSNSAIPLAYAIYQSGNIITGSAGNLPSELILQSMIDGMSITSIGANAFAGRTTLTSITIPDTVTSIGESVFAGCTSLTSVTLPNTLTSIAANLFNGCTSLTSITLPDTVTSIGESAFAGCTSLTSITLPDTVTSIGANLFNGCTSLTSVTLPNTLTSLAANLFNGCTSLTSVTLPNTLTSIADLVFNMCTSLTSITIPNTVTSITYYTFNMCTSLSITFLGKSVSFGDFVLATTPGPTTNTLTYPGPTDSEFEAAAVVAGWQGSFIVV